MSGDLFLGAWDGARSPDLRSRWSGDRLESADVGRIRPLADRTLEGGRCHDVGSRTVLRPSARGRVTHRPAAAPTSLAIAGAGCLAWRLQRRSARCSGCRASAALRRLLRGGSSPERFPTRHGSPTTRPLGRVRFASTAVEHLSLELGPRAGRADPTLDCTGGFYSSRRWRGVLVASRPSRHAPRPAVGVISHTGTAGSSPRRRAKPAARTVSGSAATAIAPPPASWLPHAAGFSGSSGLSASSSPTRPISARRHRRF